MRFFSPSSFYTYFFKGRAYARFHIFLCVAAFSAAQAEAFDETITSSAPPSVRLDTPSGFPVPRYVSLKAKRVNCRIGPSKAHPVRFTYVKKGAPVIVIAETKDHWRKIRDKAGMSCWVHKTLLTAVTHVYATRNFDLTAKPRSETRIRAKISQGAMVRLSMTRGGWAKISTGAIAGWAPADALWGAGDASLDAAPHN